MSNITIKYIVYTPGHRRHHAGSQSNLIPATTGHASNGDSYPIFAFDRLQYQGNNLPFAFMSVNGAGDGNHLYTSSGNYTVEIGTQDVEALIVYAPVGGGGGSGSPGVWVDAFNVDTGEFSDSDFVQVFTNGAIDSNETTSANDKGWVDSVSPEDLKSLSTVDGVPFSEWKKIGGSDIQNIDYQLVQRESGFVFAFFMTPDRLTIKRPTEESIWQWVDHGTMVDGGPHPWNPEFRFLLSGIVMAHLASLTSPAMRKEVLGIAAKQISTASDAIVKEIKKTAGAINDKTQTR